MPKTQEWIKQKLAEDRLGENVEYTNMRLTKELVEVREMIKQLQIDMAHMIKKYEQ